MLENLNLICHQYDQNNVFYKIINGSIPADILLEDDDFIAINDINPQAKYHILCIPKGCYIDFTDLVEQNADLMAKMSKFILKITQQLKLKSYRLVNNCGTSAGQTVMHFHMHILSNENQDANQYKSLSNSFA